MPDWTKKNFDELPDVGPPDAGLQWRFAREALGSPELGVSRFTYEPGARMPWGHRHGVQEEAYVVVGGSGRAKLDSEVVKLAVWDVLRVWAPSWRAGCAQLWWCPAHAIAAKTSAAPQAITTAAI